MQQFDDRTTMPVPARHLAACVRRASIVDAAIFAAALLFVSAITAGLLS